MEAERQKFVEQGQVDKKGNINVVGSATPVGPVQKFEFGSPDDNITAVVGGGYTSFWNPDFLQHKFGKEGTCARFYYDRKMVVDVGDPEQKINRRKRKLLHRHGFGYMCIPTGFPQEKSKLKKLYQASLEEYFNYEKQHPRPVVLQETTIVDSQGNVRRALVTAIDVKVGGGLEGSAEQQQAEMKHSFKLSKKEIKRLKLQSKLHRKLRRNAQAGIPFRNPFITHTKRQYPVQYVQ